MQGLPAGAQLVQSAKYGYAEIVWTPTANQVGQYDLSVQVSDQGLPPKDLGYPVPEGFVAVPNVVAQDIRIVVRATNLTPELLDIQVQQGGSVVQQADQIILQAQEGQPLTWTMTVKDADLDQLYWSFSALPKGVNITTQALGNGQSQLVLKWLPSMFAAQSSLGSSQLGNYNFTVTVTDGSAKLNRNVQIQVANVNQQPVFTSLPLQLVYEGETLSFNLLAQDGDNDALRYQLVHDANTPADIYVDATTGYVEWTPANNIVDNQFGDQKAFDLTFMVTDGQISVLKTVQVRVLDVNKAPKIQSSNRTLVVGQQFQLDIVKSAQNSLNNNRNIYVSDIDGQAQTQGLIVSFDQLPQGASYDAVTGRLSWIPNAGQIGKFVAYVKVSDGYDTVRQAITFNVVADRNAYEPTLHIETTPAIPVVAGQIVTATVRADSFSAIANTMVEVRGSALGTDQWQVASLDSTGRIKLIGQQPGLIEIRATAIDIDGFSQQQVQTIRVKDPQDNLAPVLTWQGQLKGAAITTAPIVVQNITDLTASIKEQQLMGYKLEIARNTTGLLQWHTLQDVSLKASYSNQTLDIFTIDPALFVNGAYQLRLTAWDLVGRVEELYANIEINSVTKQLNQATYVDASLQIGSQTIDLVRSITTDSHGDFSNWTTGLFDTQLTHNQRLNNSVGTVAAWQTGAKVWLQIPQGLTGVTAIQTQYLNFTLNLQTQDVTGENKGIHQFTPQFSNVQGWSLTAHSSADLHIDNLIQQGQSLYNESTGLAWVPSYFNLTAPDGTRYLLDQAGKVLSIHFNTGEQWLVSQNNIVLVGGKTSQSIEFKRDSQGRISQILGQGIQGEQVSLLYKYNSANQLELVRNLITGEVVQRYSYTATGEVRLEKAIAYLGASVDWLNQNHSAPQWQGDLNNQTQYFDFAIRESELASTIKAMGATGAVLVAIETQGNVQNINVADATIVSQQRHGDHTVTLVRITSAGFKQLAISGVGAVAVRLSIVGDLNHDGNVDGLDSTLLQQAQEGQNQFDLNGDGLINHADLQILYANYGWKSNKAPVNVVPQGTQALKTHRDLSVTGQLDQIAVDREGDAVYWNILSSTHGVAQLSYNGKNLSFKPEVGFSGYATVTLQADDGYSKGQPIELKIYVSDAKLVLIHIERLAAVALGNSAGLHVRGDFADEEGVTLTADYLQFVSDNPDVLTVDAKGNITTKKSGIATVHVSARGIEGVNVISVDHSIYTPYADQDGFEVDVYPRAVNLPLSATRQLKVHDADGNYISQATTGIKYYISDSNIADITADGLVIPKVLGKAKITIIYQNMQTEIVLNVQQELLGTIKVSNKEGGITSDSSGNILMVASGSLPDGTAVSIEKVALDSVGIPLPAKEYLAGLGAFTIDLSGETATKPLQLGIKVGDSYIDPQTGSTEQLNEGTEVLFWRKGIFTDANGVERETWWLLDNGFVDAKGMARTASPPFGGVSVSGTVVITTRIKNVDKKTGAMTIVQSSTDYSFIYSMAANAVMSVGRGGLVGLAIDSAFTLYDSFSVVTYTLAGSYSKEVPVNKDDGGITINKIEVPKNNNVEEPSISGYSFNANTNELTVDVQNVSNAFDLNIWLVPQGDQLDHPRNKAEHGLIWKSYKANWKSGNTYSIVIDDGIALGLHNIYLEKKLYTYTDNGIRIASDYSEYSDFVSLKVQAPKVSIALSNKEIIITEQGKQTSDFGVKRIVNADEKGNGLFLYLPSNKTDPITYNEQGTLAFIAGRNTIYVLDMISYKIVDSITVNSSGEYISALLYNDGWLYVSSYGPSPLIRINVDELSTEFLKVQQSLDISTAAVTGFGDMAISHGRYLAVIASVSNRGVLGGIGGAVYWTKDPVGDIYVIDLNKINYQGEFTDNNGVDIINAIDLGNIGQRPMRIAEGLYAGEFIMTSLRDVNQGVSTIKVGLDNQGNLTQSSVHKKIRLKPTYTQRDYNPRARTNRQEIQNSSDVVLVNYNNMMYALVADYNFWFNDTSVSEYGMWGVNKRIGGKIGIIQDPFGYYGEPMFIGSTIPIIGASIETLTITDNGLLQASVWMDEMGGPDDSYYSRMFRSVFVWNVQDLLDSADRFIKAGKVDTQKPIDAALPSRFDDLTGTNVFYNSVKTIQSYSHEQSSIFDLDSYLHSESDKDDQPAAPTPSSEKPDYSGLDIKSMGSVGNSLVREYAKNLYISSMVQVELVKNLYGSATPELEKVDIAKQLFLSTFADAKSAEFALTTADTELFGVFSQLINMSIQEIEVTLRLSILGEHLLNKDMKWMLDQLNIVFPTPTISIEALNDSINLESLNGLLNGEDVEIQLTDNAMSLKGAGQALVVILSLTKGAPPNTIYMASKAETVVATNVVRSSFRTAAQIAKEVSPQLLKQSLQRSKNLAATAASVATKNVSSIIKEQNQIVKIQKSVATAIRDAIAKNAKTIKQVAATTAAIASVSSIISQSSGVTNPGSGTSSGSEKKEQKRKNTDSYFVGGNSILTDKTYNIFKDLIENGDGIKYDSTTQASLLKEYLEDLIDRKILFAGWSNLVEAKVVTLSTTGQKTSDSKGFAQVAIELYLPMSPTGSENEGLVVESNVVTSSKVLWKTIQINTRNLSYLFDHYITKKDLKGEKYQYNYTYDTSALENKNKIMAGFTINVRSENNEVVFDAMWGDTIEIDLNLKALRDKNLFASVIQHELTEISQLYMKASKLKSNAAALKVLLTDGRYDEHEIAKRASDELLAEQLAVEFDDGTTLHRYLNDETSPYGESKWMGSLHEEAVQKHIQETHNLSNGEYFGQVNYQLYVKSKDADGKDIYVPKVYKFIDSKTGAYEQSVRGYFDGLYFDAKNMALQIVEAKSSLQQYMKDAVKDGINSLNAQLLDNLYEEIKNSIGYQPNQKYLYRDILKQDDENEEIVIRIFNEDLIKRLKEIQSDIGINIITKADDGGYYLKKQGNIQKNSGSVGVNQSLELYLRFYEKTTSSDTAEQNIKKANPYDKYYIVNSSNYTQFADGTVKRAKNQDQAMQILLSNIVEQQYQLNRVSIEHLLESAQQYWINLGVDASLFDQVSLSIQDININGTIAYVENGNHIVLSPNAAGYGWFIDESPFEHTEFTMNSTQNYGVASNSQISTQIDLLTVLIHELGHTIGLTDTFISQDLMGGFIQQGIRLLPTQQNLQGWQAQKPSNTQQEDNDPTHYFVVGALSINPKTAPLWNSQNLQIQQMFQNTNTGLSGWKIFGEIKQNQEDIVLNETHQQHTNLSQAFKLGAQDKVLTFTVKDQHLADYNNSPDDAFEVALLDAHTGEALFKVSDLNNTDALFNLQANGQNYLAHGIERVINSDGSQTFFINLDQALAGRDVLLSFDLLGFGAADSSVTLNNIRLVAEPLAVNDHYQFDEDTTITGNVLNNDLLIGKSIENVVLVTAPQHGELVLLANGEFSYVPHANYFGQDQFSYYFTTVDGQQSKVATVQLEINAVNDAPVFNTQPQWEIVAGEPLVLDFDAYVQDAENNPITVQIAQQPQNGVISYDAATGHYVYLVDKAFVGDDAFSVVLTDGIESSQPYTFTIHVLASNTAPVLHEQIISTDEDQTLAFDPLVSAYDAEGDQLTAQFSALPQHGRLEQLANGHYQYVPDANYFGTDSFSYFVTDGKLNSQVVNVSITVNAVNDAPVAVPKTIYGSEDQALLLHWNDFLVSDIDGDLITIKITELPASGQLQHLTSEGQWVVVRINDVFTQSEIESGKLRFIPELNASGSQGYLAQGLGNKKQHYAQFVYVALDGKTQSQNTVMTIDIEAVADKPELVIGEPQTDQEELFRTTWEAAPNKDKTSTLLERRYLEGWRLIKTPNRSQTGRDGFEIWSNGDQMQNAADQMITVYANKTVAGQNWLELNDADAFVAQTLGIEREVQTVFGQKYTLTFDYAGRLGFSQSFTQIGIYVDGKRIASYANTSPNDQLNWQNIQFSFTGTGQIQNLQIIIEAPLTHTHGRGAMIDNIVLSKSKLLNHGKEDQPIALSSIHAKLTDNDGSEQLKLALAGLPLGSKVNDGVNEFIVTELHTIVDITNWNLDTLKLTPPKDFSGELKLQVIASSIEQSNSSIATSTQELTVFVEAVADAPSLETHQSQHALTSREVFHTEWRGVYNSILNKNPTVVYGWSLDGWTTHKEQLFKLDAFEVWHSGDQLKNTSGQNIPLQGLNSNIWIRLNDGKDTLYQQTAIERQVNTVAGTTYSLSFDLAGLLGQAANMGCIGVYVDGQQIAVFDAPSGQNALNWQEQQVSFEGNGCNRTIRLQLEGNTFGRTAFVSNIRLVETYTSTENLVYAMIGQTSYLPIIAARSNDQDGSEQLKLELSGFNQGTVLTDGTHYATVSSTQQLVDITLWDWTQIHFASDSNQDMTIQIKATSIEQSNQQSTSTLKTVTVKMLGGQACLSPWQLVNGFVSTWVNHVESIPLHVKAHWSCQIPLLSAQLDLNILPKDEDEDLIILGQEEQSDAWLKALERTAQQNWKQLF
ncbi:tandem-95 repeat protein [Acinetobacter nosocomialis]|nr:tandem-95 repeat protein [Acinetobacter nosocomialis]EHU1210218.1 tandem-95 repeat protein [Acinetobacter nosocomialis]MCF1272184.1 tandem-95 repeat protein [Acinetobacter nosocomialis]MDV5586172.1 tandem-95 repeat protein [Acinetobacter nosocomialis]